MNEQRQVTVRRNWLGRGATGAAKRGSGPVPQCVEEDTILEYMSTTF